MVCVCDPISCLVTANPNKLFGTCSPEKQSKASVIPILAVLQFPFVLEQKVDEKENLYNNLMYPNSQIEPDLH